MAKFLFKPHNECNAKRLVNRQLLSKMFPLFDLNVTSSNLPDHGSCSQKLMLKHRLIRSASPGTYYILPPLLRSLEKLHHIIDHEMHSIGAQKLAMPCLAPKQLWDNCGRWKTMGAELFTLSDRTEAEHCLAPTHEEAITSIIAAESPLSYRRLPIRLYQIGRKFRDEARPKHGLMRCREFEMKDLYTFDADAESAESTFVEVCEAYVRILTRLGLPFVQVAASSGGMGGSVSQEFHLLSPVGEDALHCCSLCGKGVNAALSEIETVPTNCSQKDCPGTFQQQSGIEVAHAFILGTTYSELLRAIYIDSRTNKRPLYMDCFGIGTTRLLAASVEVLSSSDELRWPRLLAPYQICIIPQKEGYKSDVTMSLAESVYDELTTKCTQLSREVVIDDRLQMSIGHRVHIARVSGFPHVVVLGKKALSESPSFEYINVYDGTTKFLCQSELVNELSSIETV